MGQGRRAASRRESDRPFHFGQGQRGGGRTDDPYTTRSENRRGLKLLAAAARTSQVHRRRRSRASGVARESADRPTATKNDHHVDPHPGTLRPSDAHRGGSPTTCPRRDKACDGSGRLAANAAGQFVSAGVSAGVGSTTGSAGSWATTNSFATCEIPGSRRTNRSARIRS